MSISMPSITELMENPKLLEDIKDPTPTQCHAAIISKGWAIAYVEKPSLDLCLLAIKTDRGAMKHIPKISLTSALYVKMFTEEIPLHRYDLIVFEQRFSNITRIKAMVLIVAKKMGVVRDKEVLSPDDEAHVVRLIESTPTLLLEIPFPAITYDMCKIAVSGDARYLEYIGVNFSKIGISEDQFKKLENSVKNINTRDKVVHKILQ